jgi:hypothetical protein
MIVDLGEFCMLWLFVTAICGIGNLIYTYRKKTGVFKDLNN